jgi:hypothetical protein
MIMTVRKSLIVYSRKGEREREREREREVG